LPDAQASLPMIPVLCVPSVSTPPGLIALTRFFFGTSSFASTRVIVSTAPLVAEYTTAVGVGLMDAIELMLMMLPPARELRRRSRPQAPRSS
jgi:hypothetical protein